ncbi:uncharacterized protein LOC134820124 [Bolinopsis microptera]|uniref:uncharacterized protein LOC134820124 n=1 Tax=Bolinopsis microptera TaxID=2820187 RepID=UPI0030797985
MGSIMKCESDNKNIIILVEKTADRVTIKNAGRVLYTQAFTYNDGNCRVATTIVKTQVWEYSGWLGLAVENSAEKQDTTERIDSDKAAEAIEEVSNWLPVKREVKIEWDLESTPLEIRTNSVLGSDNMVYVDFYSAGGEFAGAVALFFTSTPQYNLSWCTSSTNFPVNLPSTADKVWRITRTAGVRVVIHCNEVEVLNIMISLATCDGSWWSTIWNTDVAKIKFSSSDTASDYYRTQPVSCTGLKAEWRTTIWTTTQFPVVPGTVVEVNCVESRALNKGSSESRVEKDL